MFKIGAIALVVLALTGCGTVRQLQSAIGRQLQSAETTQKTKVVPMPVAAACTRTETNQANTECLAAIHAQPTSPGTSASSAQALVMPRPVICVNTASLDHTGFTTCN